MSSELSRPKVPESFAALEEGLLTALRAYVGALLDLEQGRLSKPQQTPDRVPEPFRTRPDSMLPFQGTIPPGPTGFLKRGKP